MYQNIAWFQTRSCRPHMADFRVQVFAALTILIVLNYFPVSPNGVQGPFDMYVQEASECEDNGTGDIQISHPRVGRVGRNRIELTSHVILSVPLDESLGLRINVAVWGNGGWKSNFFHLDQDSMIEWIDTTVPHLKTALTEMSGVDDFPIPPGEYNLTVSARDFTVKGIDKLPYGKYLANVDIVKAPTVLGCFSLTVNIIPKKVRKVKKKSKALTAI